MNAYDLQHQGLPGGISAGKFVNENSATRFSFKPMTGDVEFLLQELSYDKSSRPKLISRLLVGVLEVLGDKKVDLDSVRGLSIGDRDYILTALAALLNDEPLWLTVKCIKCTELMDVSFRFADLPTKRIKSGFVLEKNIKISLGDIVVRIPTGTDHEAIAEVVDDKKAYEKLLQRLVTINGKESISDVDSMNDHDLHTIETQIESMSPEVANELAAQCPHCESHNRVRIDVFSLLKSSHGDIFTEIHQLAANYHWSEKDIISLPTVRRKRYLQLIDSARGVKSERHPIEVQ